MFVASNLILEIPSAVFDQLSSVHKPQYVLLSMLMSLTTMLICIIELVYKGGEARVGWRWRKKIPWFYYPPPSDKPFGAYVQPEFVERQLEEGGQKVRVANGICRSLSSSRCFEISILG
ncbi:hypothetical protein Q3G72_026670 [Acer saccharum]|nr:hypothetical protein Q3G72_026670 [Acer saccharum]